MLQLSALQRLDKNSSSKKFLSLIDLIVDYKKCCRPV